MRKTLILYLCIPLLLSNCSVSRKFYKIDSVKIYKSFPMAGTTADIHYAFLHPYKSTDTLYNSNYFITLNSLENLINGSKQKRDFQHKMGGITFAGEFYSQSIKHFFIYFRTVKLIIDFTDMRDFWLKSDLIN